MWSFGTTMTMAKDKEPPSAASTQAQRSAPQESQSSQPLQATIPPPQPRPPVFSQRSLKQLGLFFAGGAFLTLSALITRRAVARKHVMTMPKFYSQSNRMADKAHSDSSLIAFEALHLATLNVFGFGIMATGGLAWAFDISNFDDLKRMAQRHIGPTDGHVDEEAEQQIEEWVAKVLLRKDKKDQEAESSPKTDS
ncbi:hypothetical protein GGR52DRAFT_397263 [Hypoxylon sp. FL1284]|nr:hypothetical protein GGR52DRAFT_397263 [Hypoxylon sp. FL1284]